TKDGSDIINLTQGTVNGSVNWGAGDDGGVNWTDPNNPTGAGVLDLTNVTLNGGLVFGTGDDEFVLNAGTVNGNVLLGGISGTPPGFAGTNTDIFTINGGTIKGFINGDRGDDTIVVNGGSIDAYIAAFMGSDRILINGGAIAGNISADPVGYGTGTDYVEWNGGTIGGNIFMGRGSDTVLVTAGAGYTGSTIFNGGDDTSIADDWIDTLTLQGLAMTTPVSGANFIGWESFILDGTEIALSGTLNVGADTGYGLELTNTSTLNAVSGLSIIGNTTIDAGSIYTGFGGGSGTYSFSNLINNGLITTSDGAVGDIITVNGDYSGTGELHFDVDLELGTADKLNINGNVTGGPTGVIVTNIGVTPGDFVVPLITATSTHTADDFVLTSGETAYGDYMYDLLYTSGTWNLEAVGLVDQISELYEIFPRAIMQPLIIFPTLHQRSFNRHQGAVANVSENLTFSSKGGGRSWTEHKNTWVRMVYDTSHVVSQTSTTNSEYDLDTWTIEAGADAVIYDAANGYVVGGLIARYGETAAFAPTLTGGGSIDTNSFSLTGTATWVSHGGFYLDGQAQANWLDSDITSAATGSLAEGNRGFGYGFSLEAGKAIDLNSNTKITPQAQLKFTDVSMDDFTSPGGDTVSIRKGESLTARIGLSIETYREWENNHSHFYGIANVYRELSNGTVVNVNGTDLVNVSTVWNGEIGVGATYDWNMKNGNPVALFGELNMRTDLENFGDSYGVNFSVGLDIGF
ncbi:MAG: autotransporter outer membrane beta-barrel domain-containing protein, partial [Proteobacteria bacterium]|nr:autotransporter outer membrane beta-barrel domain-containing protein [Pseudomonadota bacterium]